MFKALLLSSSERSLIREFLCRDVRSHREDLKRQVINYWFITTPLFALNFAYLLPYVAGFGVHGALNLEMFSGIMGFFFFPIAFNFAIDIMFDRLNTNFIGYQITLMRPSVVLFERILFYTLCIFCVILPVYPIASLVMGVAPLLLSVSLPHFLMVLFFGSLLSATINTFLACALEGPEKIQNCWMRVIFPTVQLGGMLVSWNVIATFSPLLGYVVLINPLLYITEGFKAVVLGGDAFFSVYTCLAMMLSFSLLFFAASVYYFKRSMDHI